MGLKNDIFISTARQSVINSYLLSDDYADTYL